jgi:SAM-dependent methyltransferase
MSDQQNEQTFYEYLLSEYHHPFAWGDWSYLEGRRVELPIERPWSYADSVVEAMRTAQAVLDMRTGDGGMFASFIRQQSHPMQLYATEGYSPILALTRRHLEPLGVTIYEVDDEHLPIADEQLDLVINRHGSYDLHEIKRVLKPGQRFITQQVGEQTNLRLHELLQTPRLSTGDVPAWNLAVAVRELQQAGWHIIEKREGFAPTRFYDVGAVVYYLKAIAWEIPDFSVERYFDKLVAIRRLIEREGYLEVVFHTFFIVAQKPLP